MGVWWLVDHTVFSWVESRSWCKKLWSNVNAHIQELFVTLILCYESIHEHMGAYEISPVL